MESSAWGMRMTATGIFKDTIMIKDRPYDPVEVM
jgi:hypothetical protein